MLILLLLSHLCFLVILLYYQKKGKMYVGYTTVLSLLFILISAVLGTALFLGGNEGQNTVLLCLILSNWILGSVIIYITSQLTLAFEKIQQLSQYIAIKEIDSRALPEEKS